MKKLWFLVLAGWIWFSMAFMSPEIGWTVNLALGNVVFFVLWLRAKHREQKWILACDQWEETARQWQASAISWQGVALRPLMRRHTYLQ